MFIFVAFLFASVVCFYFIQNSENLSKKTKIFSCILIYLLLFIWYYAASGNFNLIPGLPFEDLWLDMIVPTIYAIVAIRAWKIGRYNNNKSALAPLVALLLSTFLLLTLFVVSNLNLVSIGIMQAIILLVLVTGLGYGSLKLHFRKNK